MRHNIDWEYYWESFDAKRLPLLKKQSVWFITMLQKKGLLLKATMSEIHSHTTTNKGRKSGTQMCPHQVKMLNVTKRQGPAILIEGNETNAKN